MLAGQLDSLCAIGRLSHDLKVRIEPKKNAQTLSDHDMVVDDENAYHDA